MAKGRRGDSPEMQQAKGETRPSRAVVSLFEDHAARPDPEDIPPPKWLKAAERRIWEEKVNRYRMRGQKVDGFQDALAQYCAIEHDLISRRKKGIDVPTSMLNAYKAFATEFYDTPASHKVPIGGSGKKDNPFANRGKR